MRYDGPTGLPGAWSTVEGVCDADVMSLFPVPAEPISPDAVRVVAETLLTQSWLDVSFLHWAADPADVAPLLPAGAVPDTHEGLTYVGLVAFRMYRVGWFRVPGIPYLGTFPETNVRLYSVDGHGRRGVVFRSLEASWRDPNKPAKQPILG